MWRIGPVLLACLALLSCGAPPASGQERFHDFGRPDDGDPSGQIYLTPEWSFWGGHDWKTFIRYENEKGFWWATTPPDPESCITARAVKSWFAAEVHVKAFEKTPKRIFFTVRFKDNLVEPTSFSYLDRRGYEIAGTLGGKNDHAWKAARFEVPGGKLARTEGEYRFRIGRSDYGDLMGALPIDWIRVSASPGELPPDAPGFYPKRPEGWFDQIAKTQVYRPGGEPVFPVGVVIKGLRTNSTQVFKKAGMNAFAWIGWENTWRPRWDVYAHGRWSDRVNAGLPDVLHLAKKHGLLYMPCFATDTRSYWIDKQYGSEPDVLEVLERTMKDNRGHSGLLAWFIKDEADHDDATWGAPVEFMQQLYNAQKRADPDRPAFVNFQAWKPNQYRAYMDAADIVGFDLYPVGRGDSASEIGKWVDRAREQIGGKRALFGIVEGHEGIHAKKSGRQLTEQEVLAQGYIAIVHGVQGLFYYIDNEAEYIDPGQMPGPWKGISQMCREVVGPGEALHPFLVPPAVVLAYPGQTALAAADDAHIHLMLRKGADRARVLIAVNDSPQKREGVSIRADGLPEGTKVRVMFEDRTLEAKGGRLVEDFDGYARHVYAWPASEQTPGKPAADL